MTGKSQSSSAPFRPYVSYLGAVLVIGAGLWLSLGTRVNMASVGGGSTSRWSFSPIGLLAVVLGAAAFVFAKSRNRARLAITAGFSVLLGAIFVFSGGVILAGAGLLLLVATGLDVLMGRRQGVVKSSQTVQQ